ncbi:hypothetical protein FEDK69T_00280 [Flavobacterium enshiense DK69]|nr:hypothetical protein FEDK69T_00280 [Flavobacterium enshiense DK69]
MLSKNRNLNSEFGNYLTECFSSVSFKIRKINFKILQINILQFY